jgi:hypothetical protein
MMNTNKRNRKDSIEKIITYRNRLNGDIVYSSSQYKTNIIDGVEFLLVFPKPAAPNTRRTNWMKKDTLERVSG